MGTKKRQGKMKQHLILMILGISMVTCSSYELNRGSPTACAHCKQFVESNPQDFTRLHEMNAEESYVALRKVSKHLLKSMGSLGGKYSRRAFFALQAIKDSGALIDGLPNDISTEEICFNLNLCN